MTRVQLVLLMVGTLTACANPILFRALTGETSSSLESPSEEETVTFTPADGFRADVRDFSNTHPDFEIAPCGVTVGMLEEQLDTSNLPKLADGKGCISPATFDEWFRDVPGVNHLSEHLLLFQAAGPPWEYTNTTFFPIDGTGFGNEGESHNYHFTVHIVTWMEVETNSSIDIAADDDIWVFVNGKLAIDLGGVHAAVTQNFAIDEATRAEFGVTLGEKVRIDVFKAERRTVDSVFGLTINSPLYHREP
ncbi:MAG: fibro-slime domain-containing protein [Spirochaetota bacterium]